MSALSPSQQPTVLFTIYQNITWTIRLLVDETIDPVTQRILFKIVGFLDQTSTINYLLFNLCFSNLVISFLVKPISAIYVGYAVTTGEAQVSRITGLI